MTTQQDEQAKSPINLLRGWPNSSLLPNTALVNSMQRVMANTPLAAEGLLYGPDEGHLPLRKSISSWLRAFYEPATSRWQKSLPSRSKSAAISIKSQPASNTPTTSTTQPSSAAPKADNKGHATTTDPLTNRITITGGASQSLGVILTVFTDPLYTRRVWIVAPGYFMSFRIFEDAGFAGRMRAVPEIQPRSDPEYDAENDIAGPDVAWLRREIAAVDAEEEQNGHEDHSPTISNSYKPPSKYPRQYRHVIYTVPNFANPSGLMTSLRTREALVRCAREFDALIICDDVYDMLQWPAEEDIAAVKASERLVAVNAGGAEAVADKHQIAAKETRDHALKAPGTAPLPRLIDIDAHLDGGPQDDYGNVISNGSFSKICAPGCRVGWIEATPTLAFAASQHGPTKSGGAPSQLTSLFMNDLLTTGVLTSHISRQLLPAYARRYALLISSVKKYLVPLGVTYPTPPRPHSKSSHTNSNSLTTSTPNSDATHPIVGGYFLWLLLPTGISSKELAKRCLEQEAVTVSGGEIFEVVGDDTQQRFDRNLRLCWAWEEEGNLEEGPRRIGRVLGKMLKDL